MKSGYFMILLTALLSAVGAYCDSRPDAEIKEALNYRTLSKCRNADERSVPEPSVTEWAYFDGDTNRLLRIMKEFYLDCSDFQKRMLLDDFVSCGQHSLPFLYSCATNPVCGDCAIKSIIAIEGVTSNSIAAAQSYFNSTNNFPRKKAYERSLLCEKLLQDVYGDDALSQYRPYVMDVALDFAQNVNTMHISLDEALVGADPSYRYSKRRLAVMRAAQMNCINQTLTNYVTNAINELVAYPESELPD